MWFTNLFVHYLVEGKCLARAQPARDKRWQFDAILCPSSPSSHGEEGDEGRKQQQICHKDNYNGKLWGQRRVWGRGMGGSSTPEVSRSTADLREKGPEVESCLQAVEIDIFALNHKQQ